MPEIAEVARLVHQIRKRLVGKTIQAVVAKDDANVFGKVGNSAAEFQKAMMGKKIVDVGQQGKYFWLIMSSPPHVVLHLGMSGWLHIQGETSLQFKSKGTSSDEDLKEEEWPPKYWKFILETSDANVEKTIDNDTSKVEAAFVDPRRFGRVRLLDCDKKDIRKTSPLKENGPDPIIDKHILSLEWLQKKVSSKHVPIKTFLLDQANISGIGNWVGDEILYNAKIHPEQYCNSLSRQQVKALHDCIMYVCETAVGVLADSKKFPPEWLFNYRWSKAELTRTAKQKRKDIGDVTEQKNIVTTCLPNGAKFTFVTVGGRTSCIVPSVQENKAHELPTNVKEDRKLNSSGERDSRVGIKKENRTLESNKKNIDDSRKRRGGLDVGLPPEYRRKSSRLQKK